MHKDFVGIDDIIEAPRTMSTRILVVGLLLSSAICVLGPRPRTAEAVAGGFGVMGDSGSDEYRADNNRGGAYGATTFNWVELLVRYRGLDVGPWGTREEPRRSGYEYNWARSGARAADVIQGGQAAGLAQQVANGKVVRALLRIGTNDFAIWNNTYREIYDGTLTGAALDNKINDLLANIQLALDTVKAAGPVDLFVANLADRGSTPAFQAAFPNAAGRQVVSGVIAAANGRLQTLAVERGVTIVDLYGMGAMWLPLVDANGNLSIGGELISFAVPGDEPHHIILGDNEHSGTVAEGLLANYVIDYMNALGLTIPKFTDQELLNNAGIFPTPPDNTAPTVSIASPLDNATISGAVTVSASASDNVNVVGVQFKLDGNNLSTEDTTAPYSKSWNTTTAAVGLHTLTAIARDAAGNLANAYVTVYVIDTTPPTVTITSPVGGAQVAGSLTVQASASDNASVAGVTFYAANTAIGPEDTVAPFAATLPTASMQNGSLTLTAVARDASGNTKTSSPVVVTVNNPVPDSTAPTVAIASPSSSSTVSGTQTVSANASDNVKVIGVQFKVDGVNQGAEDTSSPYSVSWNTTALTNGAHTITASARDAAGNAASSTVSVNVFNDVRYPSIYIVQQGSYVSGDAQSLVSDNNNYLVIRSGSSGFSAISRTDLRFTGVSRPVTALDFTVTLKSSTSSTAVTIYAYNATTSAWVQLDSVTLGTGETTRTFALTSNAAAYVDATGTVPLRVQSSKFLSAHSLSLELAKVAVRH